MALGGGSPVRAGIRQPSWQVRRTHEGLQARSQKVKMGAKKIVMHQVLGWVPAKGPRKMHGAALSLGICQAQQRFMNMANLI